MQKRDGIIKATAIKLDKSKYTDPSVLAEITKLAESIKEDGLFHRPIIRENLVLVAGGKRVLACIEAGMDIIEVTVVPDGLTDSEYRAMSLHENLKRSNPPWHVQVVLEKELHELRQSQYGEGKKGAKVGWSLRDTATELNTALGTLSEDIRMAEAIISDPSLARIGDKTTARRVILTKIKQAQQEQGARVDTGVTKDLINVCHLGGSEVLLQLYPDNTFGACITDPPWLEYHDSGLVKDKYTIKVFEQVYRVLKNPGFLYAFVSTQDWYIYQQDFKKIGFSVQKFPLIWAKEGSLTHGTKSWEYQRDFEQIILAVKGSPALTSTMLSSIVSMKIVPPVLAIHPNEKPIALIKRILDQCSFENELILDPFAGSGVVLDAARQTQRNFVGCEVNPEFHNRIVNRLKGKS